MQNKLRHVGLQATVNVDWADCCYGSLGKVGSTESQLPLSSLVS